MTPLESSVSDATFWSIILESSFTLLEASFITFKAQVGKPYFRGRLSTADLLVIASSEKLVFILEILFKLFKNKLP
jgi:hypothetical protein